MDKAITIFISYAHEDEQYREVLEKYLKPLQREGLVRVWHDRDISAGAEWEREVNHYLSTAQIILLLMSPDFMSSDYCYSIEMKRALERHEQGVARVIPVILRPVHWRIASLSKLQAVPRDAKPITEWANQDTAFLDIQRGIQKVIAALQTNVPEVLNKRLSPSTSALKEVSSVQQDNIQHAHGKAEVEIKDPIWASIPYQDIALTSYVQSIRVESDASTRHKLAQRMNEFIQEEAEFFTRPENYKKVVDAYERASGTDTDLTWFKDTRFELSEGKTAFLKLFRQNKNA